jgi:signal transduction histidine kinase
VLTQASPSASFVGPPALEDPKLVAQRATDSNPRALVGIRGLMLLAVAYYAGGRIGFLFQSESVPQSVLWLPNSILLAVLMVSPGRRWASLLAAVFPVQLLVAWQSNAPLTTMSLLFVTNVTDAMLGAALWKRVARGNATPRTLKLMLGFLFLAAAAPTLLLSFADAAITVATGWAHDYWLAYGTRARANVLTNAIFVPMAATILAARPEELRIAWRTRFGEGAALLLGLVAAAIFAFSWTTPSASAVALAYLPLPFLLWSAARFGVAMTSVVLLALAYLTTWLALHGVEGVAMYPPAEIVQGLQLQLLAIAVPTLCFAAVVQERTEASSALAESQRALHHSVKEISDLAGRLLTAEEAERTRIARDLHDDVGQQLATLSIALSGMKRRLPANSAMHEDVVTLQRHALAAADGIRALSHELHPAVLRHAGLLPAIRELCTQFARRGTVRAELRVDARDLHVSNAVALCLYRVTQEALRNAERHAKAREVQVRLGMLSDAVELTIADDGRGFTQDDARRAGGLGLTSIDERVRLVHGAVRVDSTPGHGTRVTVRVPNGASNAPNDRPTRG